MADRVIPKTGAAVIVHDSGRLARTDAASIREKLVRFGWQATTMAVTHEGTLQLDAITGAIDVIVALSPSSEAIRLAASLDAVLVPVRYLEPAVGERLPGLAITAEPVVVVRGTGWRTIAADHVTMEPANSDIPLFECPPQWSSTRITRFTIEVAGVYDHLRPRSRMGLSRQVTVTIDSPDGHATFSLAAQDEVTVDGNLHVELDAQPWRLTSGPVSVRLVPGALRVARMPAAHLRVN